MLADRRVRRILTVFCLLAAVRCFSQTNGDWSTYGHDDGSSRFSPLTQINTANVAKLKRAWTFHMTPANVKKEAAPSNPILARLFRRRSEATPLAVHGILYMPTPFSKVVALNAATGKQIWEYTIANGDNASTRGVAYWPGTGKLAPRIVFGTAAGSMIELYAKDGKPVESFGDHGVVDLKAGVTEDFPKGRFGLSSPPAIYKNVIITGARVQESPTRGPAGDTRGWDAITGKLLWRFHSVPHPGEQGIETWETPGSWKDRSGTNVWGLITVDPKTGYVFLPYGSPTTDAYGGDRAGADLYGNTLLVLNAETGQQVWHFQLLHHDTWDYDPESAPILAVVHKDGKTVPVVVVTSKTGLVFILDRNTGVPVYGVEERPVPPSDVPGEHASATEPWPLKPPPLSRMSFKRDEIATVTPEQQKFCENLFTKYPGMHNDGPFTRYGLKPSIVFPGTWGGSDWDGGSYNPQLNEIYYNVNDYADRFANTETGWPCQQPPWGELVALNLDTGEYSWREPLGIVPELEAKGLHTGTLNEGGNIVTAGGLLFVAATNDHHFRAFEAKTGKMLWDTTLEADGDATPITYMAKNGKQYVLIVATGGPFGHSSADVVAAYALP
jgi:glucose dehydrogenase